MEYDFKSLSDYDFELLCRDLLSAALGRHVESFRRGRDKGIDLRCAEIGQGTAVAQCKHYANTSFSGLYHAMQTERAKIELLNPQSYILMTSCFLTPANKDKLLTLLAPYCKGPDSILGGNEINALLRRYPFVEQAHYKLWLTSAAVLDKILHSGIYNQSELFQENISSRLKLYVQSRTAYEKARRTLDQYNCCILSGIPGIGKTTLAEILLIYYLDQGYQIVKVRSDIREAMDVYRPDTRQVFFYDDFLGSTALEMKVNKNEGKELLSFLTHISRQKGKKFILTTREYILNQARQNYEEFSRQDFDYNRCVISLADYTRADRARILYNHLYFYNVPRACIEDLLAEGRVMDIIDHPNYNPRLVESVTNLLFPPESHGFYDFFMNTLDHPDKLWENAFCRQISPAARDLLILLCPYSGSASLYELKTAYASYHRKKALEENRTLSVTDFTDALKETEGTFLLTSRFHVRYHNPSVQDFIEDYLLKHDHEFRLLCESAPDFSFCIRLGGMERRLCRYHCDALLEAIERTMKEETSSAFGLLAVLSRQLTQLLQIQHRLELPGLQKLIQDLLRRFPLLLKEEQDNLSEETWHTLASPHQLRELLSELSSEEKDAFLGQETCFHILQYAQSWFQCSFSYSLEDFLFFRDLNSFYPFDLTSDSFLPVYEALESFDQDIAWDNVSEIDYVSQCEDYLDTLKALERFFHLSLPEATDAANERIAELIDQEEENESYDSEPSGETDIRNPMTPQENILEMFQGLLLRESDTDILQ